MSLARARLSVVASFALLTACTVPQAPSSPSSTSAETAVLPALRPLARQPGSPADAPARSYVATVNYDITVPGTGEAAQEGDEGRAVFERGGASWYGMPFHRRKTASGELFDMGAMTAAHKTLPFNTRVCVRSLVNGREVLVRINDRGPYAAGRVIDLSRAAAEALDMVGLGIKQVTLSIIDRDDARCGGDVVGAAAAAASPPVQPDRAGARRKAAVKPQRRR